MSSVNYDMRRQLIVNALNNGCKTIKDVAFRFRVTSRDLHNDFAVLQEQGRIKQDGWRGRTILYSVKECHYEREA